jgi:hypothetical protein
MATAVLISGQLRTFARCYGTQKWQIFRHYDDLHFFVSILNDQKSGDISILEQDYKNVHCERYDEFENLPDIPIEKGGHAPYANAASHIRIMRQHWGNKRVFRFFCEHKPNNDFRIIIRIRPDMWIHRFQKPPEPFMKECYCPWWGKFGGINDRLAVMGNAAAFAYFETYDQIDALLAEGCPFHPETLVAASLEKAGIEIKNTLMAEFSTMRLDGSQRWPEIIWSDLAELIQNGKA